VPQLLALTYESRTRNSEHDLRDPEHDRGAHDGDRLQLRGGAADLERATRRCGRRVGRRSGRSGSPIDRPPPQFAALLYDGADRLIR
jgi:hypothetical protein